MIAVRLRRNIAREAVCRSTVPEVVGVPVIYNLAGLRTLLPAECAG
ncbi:hypothetical protein LMG28614_06873 [Paraburkholderia ultramafica]|uniref:Uncharacterized protein n=1 Tax=Paraburkholderia ultramafica TaxID=1544867 RepID=A0A6S7BQ02_9BURK|nr:hypothetical protein LMG28614_06873 [Paraburkholderia ultramafica]